MSLLDNKLPPPLVALSLAALMWLFAGQAPWNGVPFGVRIAIGILIGIVGLLVMAAGLISFRQARTTINPLKPDTATALVTSGIYRHTRNPMYLGMLLALLAWAAYLASPMALIGVLAFWFYIDRFQIRPEERALQALFGSAFTDYMSRVRRWI